jgi:Zn-dependent protease with chaperone function
MAEPVDAKEHIAPGTSFHATVGYTIALIGMPLVGLIFVVATYGVGLIVGLVALVMWKTNQRRNEALLRGSTLTVSETQFPEVHKIAVEQAERLGLASVPEVFIVETSEQNAAALKYGQKHFVVLFDDVVFGALATGNPEALSFIVGHELAHHALGHTGLIRGQVRQMWKPLSRLDEYSCDAVANALCGNLKAGRDALILLLIGPQLFKKVNREALDEQAREVVANKYTKQAEKKLTHPLLLSRYAKLVEATE